MMMRSKLACLSLCYALLPLAMHAQKEGGMRDAQLNEIKAQRTAYLTTKLALTSVEAQVFWPIYNEFDEERERLRRQRPVKKNAGNGKAETLTEQEALGILKERHAARQQELDLEKRYDDRFVESIGAMRTVKLHRAEMDFRHEVLKRYKERMGDGERRGGPPPRR